MEGCYGRFLEVLDREISQRVDTPCNISGAGYSFPLSIIFTFLILEENLSKMNM